MKVTWDQYAPQIRTDAKQVRDELMPATTAPSNSTGPATNASALLRPTSGAPITSPTNLTTPPAYQQSSPMTPILLVVGALALAGTGAWYFFFRKK
jgi:LPXTG-motif cell wall-anchored protein